MRESQSVKDRRKKYAGKKKFNLEEKAVGLLSTDR